VDCSGAGSGRSGVAGGVISPFSRKRTREKRAPDGRAKLGAVGSQSCRVNGTGWISPFLNRFKKPVLRLTLTLRQARL